MLDVVRRSFCGSKLGEGFGEGSRSGSHHHSCIFCFFGICYRGSLRGSETGLCGAQEEAKSGLDTLFFGSVLESENEVFLDLVKLLLMLVPGPKNSDFTV